MLDVAAALVDRIGLGLIDIKPKHSVTNFGIGERQGKPHIAETHNPDQGFLTTQLLKQLSLVTSTGSRLNWGALTHAAEGIEMD